MMPTKLCTRFLVFLLVLTSNVMGGGKVYLVLGSDTAIWDGMDVARYHCSYRLDLYTDPARNAYKVMDPAFRSRLVDSYGQPMKLTWWMMAGSIFRYAINKNVPIPNIMTLYLMKKYHGEAIQQFGDELTLHYHTFVWTDYNQDGIFFWNQAKSFEESRDDFDHTLAQFLIEETVYPVSFRSGWHAMDNGWQRYLDELLPYSMHNDWPVRGVDVTEPLDNIYDWSRSPNTWVPFHPSLADYQVRGNAKGWNLRSKHIGSVNASLMDTLFARAQRGEDQVACLWGHLPETDFLDNLRKIDSLAHQSAKKYNGVMFRYCTAVEAMQRWLGSSDSTAPKIVVQDEMVAGKQYYSIQTDEPIFQQQPFVAVKDVYERYKVLLCTKTGERNWRTVEGFQPGSVATLGVAVTDTVGNLATFIIPTTKEIVYVDNRDEGYRELQGNWLSVQSATWGVDSRTVMLAEKDTVKVRWFISPPELSRYNIFVQAPPVSNPAGNIVFRIISNARLVDSVFFSQPIPPNDWVYIATPTLEVSNQTYVEMVVRGTNQAGKTVAVDVMKFSPFVQSRQIVPAQEFLSLGEVSKEDTVRRAVLIYNRGLESLTINSLRSVAGTTVTNVSTPLVIPSMKSVNIPVYFIAWSMGAVSDTLLIASDDPIQPLLRIPVTADVQNYFQIVDNEDSLNYREEGVWYTSVAQAYGPSSRYTNLSSPIGAAATFSTTVKRDGLYNVQYIVPKTVNSANKALYVIRTQGGEEDSIVVDQNAGSGVWVTLRRYRLLGGTLLSVKIVNTGKNTAGAVLRADAIKIKWVGPMVSVENDATEATPHEFVLAQNYPNPFNPSTTIRFGVPTQSAVRIIVLNTLGQQVAELTDGIFSAGYHQILWNATGIASGVYFYHINAISLTNAGNRFMSVQKMIVVK